MAVSKEKTGGYASLSGTLSEVTKALSDNGIPSSKVIAMYYDQGDSKHVAVYIV